MSSFSVEVKGLAELQATLSRLPGMIQERIGVQAMSAAAKVIQDEMANRAPIRQTTADQPAPKKAYGSKKKGDFRFPGNLKRHITRRRVRAASGTMISYEVGPSGAAWYGRLVEMGTKHASAHPFMRPAVDTKANEAINTFAATLDSKLDAAVKASQ
jgi:HK97 gp10 family phage protein